MATSTQTVRLGLLIGFVAVALCLFQAEPVLAQGGQLKLPTTWDYVQGFTTGGLDAWNQVQGLRGRRAVRRGTGRSARGYRRPVQYGSHTVRYYPSTTAYVSPGYYGRQLPSNTAPAPHRAPAANPLPGAVRVPGQIRPIDESLANLPGGTIVNPEENGATLRYRLDGEPFELPPGHYQDLGLSRTWAIEFDRGGHFGHGRYAVGGARHTFTPTEKGWELYQE